MIGVIGTILGFVLGYYMATRNANIDLSGRKNYQAGIW